MKMLVFIINPVSGSGKALKVWEKIKQELDSKNVEYRSFFTKYQGHAAEIAQQVAELHQDKLEAIIAVGGDGTVHEVVNGLVHYPSVSIGHIPGGSGNDFARGFAIPNAPLKALEKILKGQDRSRRKVDIGRYQFPARKREQPRFFVNGIGIGFDGDVAKATNESGYKVFLNKIRCGGIAYLISALRMLFTYQTHQIVVQIDGETKEFSDVWLMAICNNPFLGGGMNVTPKAKVNDGKLNICIVHQINKWKLLSVFGTVFLGKHTKYNGVTILEGKQIEVSSPKPITIHADGEIIGTTPISIQIDAQSRKIC